MKPPLVVCAPIAVSLLLHANLAAAEPSRDDDGHRPVPVDAATHADASASPASRSAPPLDATTPPAGAASPTRPEPLKVGFALHMFGRFEFDDGDAEGRALLRRARFSLTGTPTDRVTFYAQNDIGTEGRSNGLDMRLLDFRADWKVQPWLNVSTGLMSAPVSRQNLTSSSSFVGIDRASIHAHHLSRSFQTNRAFATERWDGAANGPSTRAPTRVIGATAWKSLPLGGDVHLRYQAGLYEGVPGATIENPQWAGRIQVNVGEPEQDYGLRGHTHGRKPTLAVGVGVDGQDDIARTADGTHADYRFLAADVFLEHPLGPGALSAEGGFFLTSITHADRLILSGDTPIDLRASTGRGGYLQAGYLIGDWQPWIAADAWAPEGDSGMRWTSRLGTNWYFDDRRAAIRFAGEAGQRGDEKVLATLLLALTAAY